MQYVSCLLLLLCTIAHADTRTKVAVIDTGINELALSNGYFCKSGHKDVSGTGLADRHGHGTMVTAEISKSLNPKTHCIVVIKWVDRNNEEIAQKQNLARVVLAVSYAIAIDAKFINMSLGGPGFNRLERDVLSVALSRGITVAVAAGNENSNLSATCDYFPACYAFNNKNFIVVANYDGPFKQPSSNYGGPVNAYEYGPSGTSQSTAIYLGKLIRGIYEKKCTDTCPAPKRLRH